MTFVMAEEELAERLYFALMEQADGKLEDDRDLRVRDLDGRLVLDCRKLAKAILQD